MRLAQLQRPLQAVAAGCYRSALSYSLALRPAPTPKPLAGPIDGRRYASVKSQGAYKLRPRKTIPKKLGAKRSGDQYVIPGNIIYKQRGTVWHPGENVILGRDHTIHAAVAGYVKYYRDPARHPTRQYIGVAFERDDTLPYPRHAVRKRKLGMVAVPRREGAPAELMSRSGIPRRVVRKADYDLPVVSAEAAEAAAAAVAAGKESATPAETKKAKSKKPHHLQFIAVRWQERRRTRVLHLNKDYSYSEGNAAIGRLAGQNMYVAPWKLGGRKARFRRAARRRAHEDRMKAIEERKRLAVLEEVRAMGGQGSKKPKAAAAAKGGDKKSKSNKGKKAAA